MGRKSQSEEGGRSTMDKPPRKPNSLVDPTSAKNDPVFWSTTNKHLINLYKHGKRFQAFNTSVMVTPPGVDIAEHLYVAEGGVTCHVLDDKQNCFPDLELFCLRLEELIKHSCEKVQTFDEKADQFKNSPAFDDVVDQIAYFQDAFQNISDVIKCLKYDLNVVKKMSVSAEASGTFEVSF